MDSWLVALLVKGVATVAIVFLYYVFVYKGSHLIGRFITNDRLYDFLFRERGKYDAGYGTRPSEQRRKSANNRTALTRRDGS